MSDGRAGSGRRGGAVNRPGSGWAHARAAFVLVAAVHLAGCTDTLPSAAPTTIDPPTEPGAEPPAALLLLGDGFPVAGQLGTYTWRAGGSSSPWLPGARAVVPANEPLRFELGVAVPISRWNVRYAEVGSDGPAGAVVLGEGLIRGRVLESDVVPRGAWTVELHVTFANRLGNAAYFWEITVR